MATIEVGEVIDAAWKVASSLGKGVLTRPVAVKGRIDSYVIGWLTDEAKGWDAIFLVWKDHLDKIQVKRLILLEGPKLSDIPQAEQQGDMIEVKFRPTIGSLSYPIANMEIEELPS